MFPAIHGIVSQGGSRSYATILRDDYGADEVWPLVDITSGTTIPAFVNSNRDGVLSGWDLQNTAGPVLGTFAPYSDGITDYGNIATSSLSTAWTPKIGSVFVWAKVADATVWTDNTFRMIVSLYSVPSQRIEIYKANTPNVVEAIVAISSTTTTAIPTTTTDWFSIGASWQDVSTGNLARVYFNGVQVGGDISGFGAGIGTLQTSATIGARSTTLSWKGWLSYTSLNLGGVWTPSDFAAMHAAAAMAGAD